MAKMNINLDQPATQIGELIDCLGTINNECRSADGIKKVELLWALGDTLLNVAPDANDQLLREIHQRSYITRDILRYGLIIRRGWENRDALRSQFPRLSRYSLFREALPFLKGDRCGIDDETHAKVIEQLNGGDTKKVKSFLKKLKQQKIGQTHKKGKAADRMSEPAESLRSAFKQLTTLAEDETSQLLELAGSVGDDALLRLSQVCVAMADDTSIPEIPSVNAGREPISTIHIVLSSVASANHDDQNGFRKAVGVLLLIELADLLNGIRSRERIRQWQARRKIRLTL